MPEHSIILFDGICNLCNSSVRFVIKRDPGASFKFAAFQSDAGRKLADQYKITDTGKSFILIENNQVFTRSTAALKVARKLNPPVNLLYGFIIVPAFIRNFIYDLIARKRYSWFGKTEQCMIPSPALQSRFLM